VIGAPVIPEAERNDTLSGIRLPHRVSGFRAEQFHRGSL
jgi:hypothetical protein